ncbi:MAG: tetratricopeptide repeat protein [Bacteroidia bacterium]|nr:tetratricopeptide repeat protein [Bacteroidia bacterium]
MEKTESSRSGVVLRAIVLGVGAILFILLFLADKTNLTNKKKTGLEVADISGPGQNEGINLPKLEDPKFLSLINEVEKAEASTKAGILRTLVDSLDRNFQWAYAAKYADVLLAAESSLQNQQKAGVLAYKATQTTMVQADSVLFRKFSDKAMTYLEEVVQKEEQNEEALLYLGLSYVKSGLQQNAMRGIMTIRSVLDINPDNVEASMQLGDFSMQTGQWEKASSRFLKVLKLNPNNDEARFKLAMTYAQLEKTTEAIQELDRVIKESTNDELKAAAKQVRSRF